MTVQIRIRDNSSPPNEAEQTIQVGVDNFAPIGDPSSYGNSMVAGTNVTFQGRAYDFATTPAMNTEFTPRKVKRVYAWFTKTSGGQNYYVNMNTGALGKVVNTTTTGTPTTAAMTAFSNRGANPITGGGASEETPTVINLNAPGASGPIYVPQRATGENAWNAAYVREIDQATGQPANKMLWSPVKSQNYDVKWQFTLDSTKLPDGPITLHYVVEDEAGNASYYAQPTITVMNKYPQIDRVTLYTDNTGIGAVYTTHTGNNASTEYVLNDYRNKMFANYNDTTYHTAPAVGTTPSVAGQLDKVGYLNSGFISKNKVIGFKVETLYGNRDLNFRLQYVTRERIPLTRANLKQMVEDRAKENNINLYTIAWHGDYSNAKWRALGVPIDNPMLGTHFVLQRTSIPSDDPTSPDYYEDYPVPTNSSTPQVWKYTQVASLKKDGKPANQTADDAIVFGPDNFDFSGDNFNTNASLGISEKMGSHPDLDEQDKDNPRNTAFFLIRVWDSVNPPATGSEANVNDQLYDARSSA